MQRIPWLVAILTLTFACNGSVAGGRPAPTISRLDLGPIPPTERLLDSESLQIIQEVPGYGGYWTDEDANVHACLVDLAEEARLREMLQTVVINRRPSFRDTIRPNRRIIIHRCDYNLAQLSRWKCIVGRAAAERVPEFTSWSVREPANRVNVGVETKEAIKKMRALIAMTEVPLAAVHFEVTGRITDL